MNPTVPTHPSLSPNAGPLNPVYTSNIDLICCGCPPVDTPLLVEILRSLHVALVSSLISLGLVSPGLPLFGLSLKGLLRSLVVDAGNNNPANRTASSSPFTGRLGSCFLETGIFPISIDRSRFLVVGLPPPTSETFLAIRSCTFNALLSPCNRDHQCGFFVIPISKSACAPRTRRCRINSLSSFGSIYPATSCTKSMHAIVPHPRPYMNPKFV